jgi:hypothetical protein
MSNPSIEDRLRKIKENLDIMLNQTEDNVESEITRPEEIANHFGLSLTQAKAWLKREPNYLSDDSYHGHQNRRKVNRTHKNDGL